VSHYLCRDVYWRFFPLMEAQTPWRHPPWFSLADKRLDAIHPDPEIRTGRRDVFMSIGGSGQTDSLDGVSHIKKAFDPQSGAL